MKILIGITYYLPNISGVTIYAKRLAQGLIEKGYEVTVLTSQHDLSLPLREVIDGVEVIRTPVTVKLGKGAIMFSLPWQIIKIVKNHDIVICNLPQFESFLFAIIGKIFNKKVLLIHHTDLSGWPGFFNRLSEASVWGGQILAGIFADKIIPYTKDYADNSWYLKLFKNKLEYILPPIIVSPVNKKIQIEMKKKIGQTKYVIGFAGRIAKQKGIPYLLNAIPELTKALKNFKIVFAGPYKGIIGEKYFEEINILIKEHEEYLCFLGNIPEEEMSSFYSLCNVLVLPSDDRLESFGLVQAEAMLNGCPVVATDLPGARIPVRMTGMGEVVKVGDSRLLAEGIIKVVENRKKYLRKKEEIIKIFNFQNTLSDYEALFEN